MRLYRPALALIAPVVLLWLGWRVLRGRESRSDLAERMGRVPGISDGPGALIWLHAASNGELTAARPLIRALRERALARGMAAPRLAVTTNTITGRVLARGLPPDLGLVRATLAPLDLRGALMSFLARTRPDLALSIENELWPNRLDILHARRIPVAIAGARMSGRSAARWGRFGGLMADMLARIDWLAPLDVVSGARFAKLGLPASNLQAPIDLKAAAAGPAEPFANRPAHWARTVLAASTHEGDEALLLASFATLHAAEPDARLILALRHPRRAAEVAALVARSGLGARLRSLGAGAEDLDADHPVLIADTLGEMARWYGAAGLTIIGGSFGDRGGHTPYEPVAAGSAVLHGPDMTNFTKAAGALAISDAQVTRKTLAPRMAGLLNGGARALDDLAARQRAALLTAGPDLGSAADAILDLIAGCDG